MLLVTLPATTGISSEHAVVGTRTYTRGVTFSMGAEVEVTLESRGGHSGRGGRGSHAGRHNDRPPAQADKRNVATANSTAIVEYDASTSTIKTQSTQSDGEWEGRTGGRFGPRRADGLATPTSDALAPALGHVQHVVSEIRSTTRYRSIRSLETTHSNPPRTVARCELDSHADTCVAKPNFQLDEYTGEFCNVTPYSHEYQPLTNIPIVNASTAFTDDKSVETVNFRFNQVLWYGDKLPMRLINPI